MGTDAGFPERLPDAEHLAFRALFDQFYRPLLGYFLKRGCSEPEREDLAQETLLNAYRGFERFRREASDTTWIFSIAGNIWLNTLRSQRTLKRGAPSVSLEQMTDSSPANEAVASRDQGASALDRILQDERKQQLRAAIRELPEGRRHVLHLRIIHGLRYREIAQLLKIEVNTVKSQIFQARKQLKEKLTPQLESPAGKNGR